MEFGLSRTQALLRDSARDLVRQSVPVERVRRVLPSEATEIDRARSESAAIRTELGRQGLLGLLVPEPRGGEGLGLLEAAVVAQELGYGAVPLSFHSSAVAAPLLLSADEAAAERWLGDVAGGSVLATVCWDVEAREDGSLRALWVPDAATADLHLVVLPAASGGGCIVLESAAPGLETIDQLVLDETRSLGEVRIPAAARERALGLDAVDAAVVARARDAARVALAADVLGACYRSLEMAVEYAKGRRQFGRVVASFQAVKHLCAEMIAEVDPVQSLLWRVAYAWDRREPEAAWLAPLLKAHAADVGAEVASKSTQVFGGIGFTWECDLHLWYKRLAYGRQVLGRPEELRALAMSLQLDG